MGIFKRKDGRSPNWYMGFYYRGRYYRESTKTSSKRIALQRFHTRKVEIIKGDFIDVRHEGKLTLKELVKLFLEYSKTNKKSYRRDIDLTNNLLNFFGDKEAYKIKPLEIEQYKAKRKAEVVEATVNRELACLKTMFNKAIEWGKLKDNPVRKIKLFKEQNKRLRYLTKEEINKLLNVCADHLKPIIITALNTGMRKREILNLKWNDVNLEQEIIYVRETKNQEMGEIPMNNVLYNSITNLRKNNNSQYVFSNGNENPYRDIKTAFNNAIKKAGIIDFKFHDLRHTFASHLAMAGVDILTIKELLRHKTLAMTLRYAHLSPGHKREAVYKLQKSLDLDAKTGG